MSGRRVPMLLVAGFGVLALLLASVGVYSMFASMAAAREREFGVRMALGSSRAAIARLVLRQGGVWLAMGLAGGAVGVLVVARLLEGLLFGIAPLDPVVLGGTAAVLLVCSEVALAVPLGALPVPIRSPCCDSPRSRQGGDHVHVASPAGYDAELLLRHPAEWARSVAQPC